MALLAKLKKIKGLKKWGKKAVAVGCLVFLGVVVYELFPLGGGVVEGLKISSFNNMSSQKISDLISRQYIYGEKMMVCRWTLKKGALIPKHSHPNEQVTYIPSGSVKVTFGGKEYIIQSGGVLIIPANTPHQFEALEDTIDIDIFSPPREDWIKGTDSYLHSH